ncbi:MAG: guanylate kinase [Atribacterota bacterium]
MSGILFVISGPSGVGKSTVRKEVMQRCKGLRYSVSYTARTPRPGETNGVDYYFISEGTFLEMRDQGEFIEWARVHGNLYGTSRRQMEEWLENGLDVILEIDVQGAMQVKMNYPQGIFIFIAPPSLKELGQRLRGRNTDEEEVILLRMTNAQSELQSIRDYDYLIVNDDLNRTMATFRAVIIAERCRIR